MSDSLWPHELYSPWGHKESDTTARLSRAKHTHESFCICLKLTQHFKQLCFNKKFSKKTQQKCDPVISARIGLLHLPPRCSPCPHHFRGSSYTLQSLMYILSLKCVQMPAGQGLHVVIICHNFGCTSLWNPFPCFGNWVFVSTHILQRKFLGIHVPRHLHC